MIFFQRSDGIFIVAQLPKEKYKIFVLTTEPLYIAADDTMILFNFPFDTLEQTRKWESSILFLYSLI